MLNGEKLKSLPNLSDYKLICATHGAYNFLEAKKIIPHLIARCFDFIIHILKNIEVIYTPNQNFIDFEKALQVLHKKDYSVVDVFSRK